MCIRDSFISDLYIQFDMPFKSLVVPFLKRIEKKIKELAKKEKFDIIRTINILPTYAAISNKDEIKIPIYAELTDFISDLYIQFDMPFKNLAVPFLKRIEKKIARNVDYANVETELGRDFWHENGLDKGRIVVIPNGVDTEHFNPAKTNPSIITVSYTHLTLPTIYSV